MHKEFKYKIVEEKALKETSKRANKAYAFLPPRLIRSRPKRKSSTPTQRSRS